MFHFFPNAHSSLFFSNYLAVIFSKLHSFSFSIDLRQKSSCVSGSICSVQKILRGCDMCFSSVTNVRWITGSNLLMQFCPVRFYILLLSFDILLLDRCPIWNLLVSWFLLWPNRFVSFLLPGLIPLYPF